jgi:hypothetical protein
MGRDLLTRPYGRFYYLPKLLADRGHEVHLLLLSHKKDADISTHAHGFSWSSTSIFNTGPVRYLKQTRKIVRDVRPDWTIGFSDTYYGILAQKLADRYGMKSSIDAYDIFGASRYPERHSSQLPAPVLSRSSRSRVAHNRP